MGTDETAGSSAPLILQGVSKRFGSVLAVHPLDLEAPSGRTLVLLGTSGSGKSTLLRMMAGLVAPDSGTVWFEGQRVTPEASSALRHRMGFALQGGGLFPHLTAGENVALMARQLDWTKERIRERLDALLGLTQLSGELLGRYPAQLSGGQRQRVSLMRALMLEPGILLLDEPLGALDPITRSDLQSDLRRVFHTTGQTVVLVTHDLGEAAFLGNRLVLLDGGRVVQQGTLADLLERPSTPFVERFVRAQRPVLSEAAG